MSNRLVSAQLIGALVLLAGMPLHAAQTPLAGVAQMSARAVVSGIGGSTGVGIVEIFKAD